VAHGAQSAPSVLWCRFRECAILGLKDDRTRLDVEQRSGTPNARPGREWSQHGRDATERTSDSAAAARPAAGIDTPRR
jgi:hypothetical protein